MNYQIQVTDNGYVLYALINGVNHSFVYVNFNDMMANVTQIEANRLAALNPPPVV